jgi:hypothetical protein
VEAREVLATLVAVDLLLLMAVMDRVMGRVDLGIGVTPTALQVVEQMAL